MGHTGGCSGRSVDSGFVGVSALEGENRNATISFHPCLVKLDITEDDTSLSTILILILNIIKLLLLMVTDTKQQVINASCLL